MSRAPIPAGDRGFTILGEKTQSLEVEGSVANAERIFSTRLNRVKMPKGNVKLAAAEGHINVPRALASMGAVIPDSRLTSVRMCTRSSSAAERCVAGLPVSSSAASLSERSQLSVSNALVQTEPDLLSRHPQQIAGVGVHIGIVISSVSIPPTSPTLSTRPWGWAAA